MTDRASKSKTQNKNRHCGETVWCADVPYLPTTCEVVDRTLSDFGCAPACYYVPVIEPIPAIYLGWLSAIQYQSGCPDVWRECESQCQEKPVKVKCEAGPCPTPSSESESESDEFCSDSESEDDGSWIELCDAGVKSKSAFKKFKTSGVATSRRGKGVAAVPKPCSSCGGGGSKGITA